MRIYLAGRYGRRPELVTYARELESLGHTVTSRWLSGSHEHLGAIDARAADELRGQWAREDLEDIAAADVLIAFTEGPESGVGVRGGRHVELGYALGLWKRVEIVGPRENVFCCLDHVRQWGTWSECLSALIGEARCSVEVG